MEAEVSDDMEIDDQELIIIPVKARDKGKKLLKANSTNAGVTMIQINNNSKHSDAVVCDICSHCNFNGSSKTTTCPKCDKVIPTITSPGT